MLVANFTLCTTCKNNRGAWRWAGARTPIWSPAAFGRGARILTILYNSLQLGKPGLSLARVLRSFTRTPSKSYFIALL